MCPANVRSATPSMNGSEATTTRATPAIHAASRAVEGCGTRNHASP